MLTGIVDFFNSTGFMPHGMCLLWKPSVLWVLVIANAAIALAYASIPITLTKIYLKRQDFKLKGIFLLFAAFIVLCGMTHFISIITYWKPIYGIEAVVLAMTAVVSVLTAIIFWFLMPAILRFPTTTQLDKQNTDLRQLTKELKENNQELDSFVYVASHDLKSPLNAIKNISYWIQEDLDGNVSKETQRHLNLMRGRIQRMERLLDDLLVYSRVGRDPNNFCKVLPMSEIIESVKEFLDINKPYALHLHESFSTIKVANMPMSQILLNLIVNALKHSDKEKVKIEMSVIDKGNHYVFSVSDNGPGIDKQYHQKIFEMFQTLKPRDEVEGSGMGLALIKKTLKKINQKIWVESKVGEGTTFYFSYPKSID